VDSAPLSCIPSQEQTGLNCVAELILTVQQTAQTASFCVGDGWKVPRELRVLLRPHEVSANVFPSMHNGLRCWR